MASSSSPNSFNNSSFDNSTNTIHNATTPTSFSSFPTPPTSATSSSLLSPTYSNFQHSTSSSTTTNPNPIPTTSSSYSDQLLHLFQKRIQTFIYLKHSTTGNQSWFNTIRLSKRDLDLSFSSESMKKRCLKFMLLGNSISTLFDSSTSATIPLDNSNQSAYEFCKSLLNLINELDTFMETGEQPVLNPRKQSISGGGGGTIGKNFNFFGSVKGSKGNKRTMGMGLATATGATSTGVNGGLGEFGGTGTGGAEDSIQSSGGGSGGISNAASSNGVGTGQNTSQMYGGGRDEAHLQIPNVPFQLDFFQTFFTLCDILSEVYHRLIFYLGSSPGLITLNQSLPNPPLSSGLPSNSNPQSSTLSSLMMNNSSSNQGSTSTSTVSTPGLFFNNNHNNSNSNAGTPNPGTNSSSYFPSPPNSFGLNSGNSIAGSMNSNSFGMGMGSEFESSSGRNSLETQATTNTQYTTSSKDTSRSGLSSNNQAKIELMSKVDGKLKKIITQMSKELDTLARNLIKEELNSLNPLLTELLPPIQVSPSTTTSSNPTATSNPTANHSHTFSSSSSSNNQFGGGYPQNGNHPFVNNLSGMISPVSIHDGLPSPSNGAGFPFTSNNQSSNSNGMAGLNKVHSNPNDYGTGKSQEFGFGRRPSNPNMGSESGGRDRDRTLSSNANAFNSHEVGVEDR